MYCAIKFNTKEMPFPPSAAIKVISASEECLQRLTRTDIIISVSSRVLHVINDSIANPAEARCCAPSKCAPAAITVATLDFTESGSSM
mmetsp:Transcript_10400/g.17223  ORF Transcript_10400/g.17223 Transcript_10400/m.17223 type:complete len:88 (+) Transcript_10400:249-512(+)